MYISHKLNWCLYSNVLNNTNGFVFVSNFSLSSKDREFNKY